MMKCLNASMAPAPSRPVRVLQFGEGNFLRAFVDYMIDIANEKTGFDGSIVLVKPIPMGTLLPYFHDQDYRYTVVLRGLENGTPVEKNRLVTSVSDAVDCYADYERYHNYACLDTLRFIVSNTTEAGIVLDESDSFDLCPPNSYPGKLTKFLYERAVHFNYDNSKGLIILPVELIDDNGIELKRCVKALTKIWNLGDAFDRWLDEACIFTSTLVDRIVTGYPRGEDQAIWDKLGYEDHILVTAEPFGLWVIESPKDLSSELPLPQCGLPVIYTDNQKPYKQRKVRILNGAHTSFVPMAFQCGYDIVLDAMNDATICNFMQKTLHEEVIPTLTLPKEDLEAFADAVTSRFRNPFIRHQLLSICLNCVSKWRARCMPSFMEYIRMNQQLPAHLTFSMAAMISLYRNGTLQEDGKLLCKRGSETYTLQDDAAVLSFFANHSGASAETLAKDFLSDTSFWGQDLTQVPGFLDYVVQALNDIEKLGMAAVISQRFPA